MFNEERRLARPVRWAMVGGGRGSQIGYAHRCGATRDHLFTLVASAFDIDSERGRDFGIKLGLDPARCYRDYKALFEEERQRADGIQAVSVVTPNNTHYAICRAALEAGLHVICEKPVTLYTDQARDLAVLAATNNRLLGVMYGYAGFPMVHQARRMVADGQLGEVRIVNMQFAHGFHSEEVERHDPGARWRVTPEVVGPTYVLGDAGTHAFYLGSLVTGLQVKRLLCMRQSFVPSRAPLEDNAHVLLDFRGNAVGTLWASAVNAGAMHQQRIRVVGSKASIEWWDEQPNQLRYEIQGAPAQVLERGMDYLYQADPGVAADRIGAGHPEGFFESWANLYHRFGLAIDAIDRGDRLTTKGIWYPGIDAGIQGVRLCEACAESADADSGWVNFDD